MLFFTAYFSRILAVEINPNLCAAAEENFKLNNITNAHVLVCDSAKFANQVLRTKKYALYAPTEAVESSIDAKAAASAHEPANLSTRSKKKHAAALRHAQRSTQNKGTGVGAVRAQKPRSEAIGSGDVVNTEGLFEENEASLSTEEDEDVATSALQTCSLSAADTPAPTPAVNQVSSVASTAPTRVPLYVFKFGAVLVDPPRCGLDKLTLSLVAGYAHILYISCSPESLMRDLKEVRLCLLICLCAPFLFSIC